MEVDNENSKESPTKLQTDGLYDITESTTNYYSHRHQMSMSGRREIRQRGFVIGEQVEYPTTLMTSELLHHGNYIVIDSNGEVVAKATAMNHISASYSDEEFRQYNPERHPMVADMADITKRPWTMSHHLSLSRLPCRGKYTLARKTPGGKTTVMELWIETIRHSTNWITGMELK